ncbi:hypothetical protein Ndes2526B_g03260 [Nannochloris sp. 'desiccata']
MSDWVNWAVQNVTPERLQQAMGYVKENPQQLEAIKAQAKLQADALKEKFGGEVRDAIAEEKGPEQAQTWASRLGLKSSPAPAASSSKTAVQSTRQKYIRFAVRNWKYSIPAAMWFFSFVMSWLWWAFLLVGIFMFIKHKRKPKAA